MKDLFHASADEARPTCVAVTGIAGIGKSRLSWEFFKYIDGLGRLFRWHRGRCLSYGEGVTYWALAEMVRGRAGIVEGEDRTTALSQAPRGRAGVRPRRPRSSAFVEPRLAHLLGLEDRTARDRGDLFAGWRLFFERLTEHGPVVMVFEDIQWADPSLLEFIDYLHGVVAEPPDLRPDALGRPDAGLGSAGGRAAPPPPSPWNRCRRRPWSSSCRLRPRAAARADAAGSSTAPRACRCTRWRPFGCCSTGACWSRRAPCTARRARSRTSTSPRPSTRSSPPASTASTAEERRLVQDAAVLGKTFTRAALAALSGHLEERDLEPLLAALVPKEVLSRPGRPPLARARPVRVPPGPRPARSPTRPSSKRDRKDPPPPRRRLPRTRLGRRGGGDRRGRRLAPHGRLPRGARRRGRPEIRERAARMLVRAAERAASLAAAEEAETYFRQAAEIAGLGPGTRRAHRDARPDVGAPDAPRRGDHGVRGGRDHLFEEAGQSHAAARVQARLAEVEFRQDHLEAAVERVRRAHAVMSGDEPDVDRATVAAQVGRFLAIAGRRGGRCRTSRRRSSWRRRSSSRTCTRTPCPAGPSASSATGRLDESTVLLGGPWRSRWTTTWARPRCALTTTCRWPGSRLDRFEASWRSPSRRWLDPADRRPVLGDRLARRFAPVAARPRPVGRGGGWADEARSIEELSSVPWAVVGPARPRRPSTCDGGVRGSGGPAP